MKIILLGSEYLQQFPVIDYGGIESCVENLALGLNKNKYNFKVIVPKRQIKKNYEFPIIETSKYATNISNVNSYSFCQEAIEIIKNEKPDIIWSQSAWSAENLYFLNIPIICTIHDSLTNIISSNIIKYYNNIFYRFVSKIQLELNFKNVNNNLLKNHSFFCHTGLNDEEYDFFPNKQNYFLWVAGLNWGMTNKGLDIFLKLSQDLPSKEFVCYGAGNNNLENELRNIKQSNFHFMGNLRRGQEHINVFKNANKFLMLTRLPEAFGRTTIESLSKGTPVIATNIGANRELINDSVGALIDDYENLILSLDKIYNYSEIFNYSKIFNIDNEVNKLIKISNNILNKGEVS